MTDAEKREKVIRGLEQFIDDFKPFCGNLADWQKVYDALALLRDTTNPRGGSCSTCIHEYEPGSEYCLTHQKCKVCGICSGYEGGDGDA